MKQLDLSWYWLRDVVHKEIIAPVFVPTNDQPADILTKALARPKVELFCGMLGLGRREGSWRVEEMHNQGGVLIVFDWAYSSMSLKSLKSLKYVIEVCHWSMSCDGSQTRTISNTVLFTLVYKNSSYSYWVHFLLLFVQLTVNSRYCTLFYCTQCYVQLTVNSRVILCFE